MTVSADRLGEIIVAEAIAKAVLYFPDNTEPERYADVLDTMREYLEERYSPEVLAVIYRKAARLKKSKRGGDWGSPNEVAKMDRETEAKLLRRVGIEHE